MSCKGKQLNRKCKECFIKTRKLVGINFKIFFSLYNYTGWQLGPLEIIAFCRKQVVKFAYICSIRRQRPTVTRFVEEEFRKIIFSALRFKILVSRRGLLYRELNKETLSGQQLLWLRKKDGARHDWGTFLYWSNRRSYKVGVNSSLQLIFIFDI